MTTIAIGLLIFGILMGAFFSGTETGFYRSSRVRWVLDGIEGDRVSKLLLRLANDPVLYVATTLIGSNLAANLISFAVVIWAQGVSDSQSLEMIAPLMLTPIVFVYSDLFPKSLFYLAPNRLLRKSGPVFLVFFILFSPIVAVLWVMGRLTEKVLGQSPEKVRLTLARKELDRVLQEGQEVGLLQPIQRKLGQNFFLIAAQPIEQLCLPISKIHSLPRGTPHRQAISFAQRFDLPIIIIHGERRGELLGYVRTVDLFLAPDANRTIQTWRPLLTVRASEHCGDTLMKMQSQRTDVGQVVNQQGSAVGIILLDELTRGLLGSPSV